MRSDPHSRRLADFILANTPAILAEWDTFARSVWPASEASPAEVRDHAEAILRAAAVDMKSAQTRIQQADKSKGLRDAAAQGDRLHDASGEHALGRAASGFDLRAMMAEYRALRASVVRLWFESVPDPDTHDLADLTRFHEAMDQSLAEAVHRYSEHLDKSRQMFLGVLGHDLRTPLNAIVLLSQSLAEAKSTDPETTETAAQILSSAEAAARLLSDFLEFAVSQLGRPMPVNLAPVDFAALCREVLAEVRANHPQSDCSLECSSHPHGEWDRARLRQLVSNLVNNAIQHGDPASGVTLSVASDGSTMTLRVHNEGPPIPAELLPRIFDPLVRGPNSRARQGSSGLGLYIVREVVTAHGGSIEVMSTQADGTAFTVTLPLGRPANPRAPARSG